MKIFKKILFRYTWLIFLIGGIVSIILFRNGYSVFDNVLYGGMFCIILLYASFMISSMNFMYSKEEKDKKKFDIECKDVSDFLILNGFKKITNTEYSNDKCKVSFYDGYYEVLNDEGSVNSEDMNIYWLIGYLTYYDFMDKNYGKMFNL